MGSRIQTGRKRTEKKRSDTVGARKGEIIKEETAEGKVRLVTERTDSVQKERGVKKKGKLCPLVCGSTPC